MLKLLNLLWIFVVLLKTVSSSGIIELSCEHDGDCVLFQSTETDAICSDGLCHCTVKGGKNETDCKPIVLKASNQIGGQCPCLSRNSFCDEKAQVCMCNEGYIPSRNRKLCVSKSITLGRSCEIDEQCLNYDPFSHCDANLRCACTNHFIKYDFTCHSIIASGTTECQQDSDCTNHIANSVCHDKKCICGTKFVANAENTTCLPKAHYEQECSDSNQCIAKLGIGSLCSEGKCDCNRHYFPFPVNAHNSTDEAHKVNVVCQMKVTHGASCNDDKECYQFHRGPHEQTMECYMNECVCRHGFYVRGALCLSINGSSTIGVSSLMSLLLLIAIFYSK